MEKSSEKRDYRSCVAVKNSNGDSFVRKYDDNTPSQKKNRQTKIRPWNFCTS